MQREKRCSRGPLAPHLSPAGSPGTIDSCVPPQTSACTVASVVSDKFSRLLLALEERRTSALRDLEEARSRASAQAQEVEQRLQRHLQALAEYDSRARAVLEQEDDVAFLQVGLSVPQKGRKGRWLCPSAQLTAAVPGHRNRKS